MTKVSFEELRPELELGIIAKYLVDNTYIMEIQNTIFGGKRVCLREKDDLAYIFNWCAGDKFSDIQYLKRIMLKVIAMDDVDKLPFCSHIKPYYKDDKFCKKLEAYEADID